MMVSTQAVGENGGGSKGRGSRRRNKGRTSQPGGGPMMTTQAVGENGGGFPGRPTPPPMGGGDGLPGFGGGNVSTMAVGENGGGRPGGRPMPSPGPSRGPMRWKHPPEGGRMFGSQKRVKREEEKRFEVLVVDQQ